MEGREYEVGWERRCNGVPQPPTHPHPLILPPYHLPTCSPTPRTLPPSHPPTPYPAVKNMNRSGRKHLLHPLTLHTKRVRVLLNAAAPSHIPT